MIKSIELINWKTHSHTTMNFQQGVNVLIGVMGAGKSSVIDGISFGLFGTFPKLNHKRATLSDLISNRPAIMDDAEIRITFTIGPDEYKVTRKINKKDSTASKLEKNGTYLQTQTARVNEEIENLIKVSYETFSRAIYAEQNGLDYFLELTKSERKKQIDEMLGLDAFATVETNTTSLINNIRTLINDEEQTLAKMDRNELKSQLEKLTQERNDLSREQIVLAEQSKSKEESVKRLEQELKEIKSKSERSKFLSKEIAELSSKISTLKKELSVMESKDVDKARAEIEYESAKKKVVEYESQIKSFRKEESIIQRELAEADAAIKMNRRKSEERDKLLESIKGKALEIMEKEMEEKHSMFQKSVKELASSKGRKDEAKKSADELSKHISKCPVCDRELSEQIKNELLSQKSVLLKEIDNKIAALQSEIEKTEKEISASRKDLESVRLANSKILDYKGIEELIAKSTELSRLHREKHTGITDSIDKYTKELDQLNKEMNALAVKLEELKRKEKYERDINESETSLQKNQNEMKEINFDEKALYSIQEMITKESASFSDINSKSKGNERYIKSIDMQIDERAKTLANLNEIADRIDTRRNMISSMNKFKSALIDTETQLRNNIVTSINGLMQNIWSELYPYGDYTGIRLNATKDDYSLEACTGLDANGARIWIEMDGIASGGERSVACLTMRIALAMVIVPNLRWLILDEPTHNIDQNGIGRFIEILSNSLPKVVEQIFIITHDSALKNISSARVYQLERNKDINEYTSIAEV